MTTILNDSILLETMAILTVFMTLCLIALSSSGRVCPTKWFKVGSKCFMFFNNELSWMEAEKTCLDNDANLASVHSNKEGKSISYFIKSRSPATAEVWIGGYTVSRELWLWSDGSKMIYKQWAKGEPNNANGNENCIIMHTNGRGNWNDEPCTRKVSFICATNSDPKLFNGKPIY